MGYLKRPRLHVVLDVLVVEFAANETLGVEDGVLGVGGQLVLGGIADQTVALLGERHVRRRDAVALVVRNDLHASSLEDSDATQTGKKKRREKKN